MPQCVGPTNAYFKPLHWIPRHLMNAWFMLPNVRRIMANELGKAYARFGGVGIVVCFGEGNTGRLVAHVLSNGAIEELAPPHKTFAQHLMANKPIASECACLNLYYEECQGPWRLMNRTELHHPLCEWEPVTMKLWRDPRVIGIVENGVAKAVEKHRPDLLEKLRQEHRGR